MSLYLLCSINLNVKRMEKIDLHLIIGGTKESEGKGYIEVVIGGKRYRIYINGRIEPIGES